MRCLVAIGAGLVFSLGAALLAQFNQGGREPNARQRVIQALDRLTWGIEPGQVEAVEKLGLKTWIDQQLHPDHI
ncbi:MAG: hypothetical protein ACRD2D_00835, partial [Terriglobales bacterium]